jgi:hypothetical protein
MKRQQPEAAIQRAIVEHYKARRAPGVFMFAVANGGYRHAAEAAILKGTGVVAGVPDLIWIKAGRMYGLEIKTKDGRLTEAQMIVQAAINDCGGFCATAYGLDKAVAILETWGLLQGKMQ